MPTGRDHRETGQGRHRVTAVLVVAAAAVALAVPSAGAANPSGGLLVRVLPHAGDPGVADLYLSPAELDRANDVIKLTYTKRYANGQTDEEPLTGTSAAAVAELAGVPRANVDGLELRAPDDSGGGTPLVTLSRSEVVDGFFGDPRTAFDGLPRQLVFRNINAAAGGEQLAFRPLRDGADVNPVEIGPPGGQTMRVSIATVEGTVAVSVTADRTQVDPQQPVALTARVAGDRGAVADVRWVYGDGTDSAGSDLRPTHVYAQAGSYRVRAMVTTTSGASGVGTVDVRVGTPPTPDPGSGSPGGEGAGAGGTPGTGTGEASDPAAGPDVGNGGAVGARPGPSSARTPRQTGSTTGDRHRRRPAAGRRPTARRPRTATPTPPLPATTPERSPATGGTDGSGGGGASGAGAPGPRGGGATAGSAGPSRAASGRRRTPSVAPTRPADPAGEPIDGVLVGARPVAATTLATADRDRAPAARRGGEPRHRSPRPFWLLGGVAVTALLGLGLRRELRPAVLRSPTLDGPAR